MKILFYIKLACVNIKKNMKFYLPYIATATFTVMMFYMFCFLITNKGIDAMGPTTAAGLRSIFSFGKIVIGIFSMIFLFYTNSFVIKRRKKELGVYNVLGMEKRHLAFVILIESIIISLITILGGLLLGILFSKLMLVFLLKIIRLTAGFGFEISVQGIKTTLILFAFVFGINLLYNLLQIALTKPINLLSGSNVGEKEPKTKWILTVIGCGCMIAGYILANNIQSPLKAISVFFTAVLLVIAGTYLLFIAVSITILKVMKKSKKFYYRPDRFVTISGMLYRMKQNAAGLASICILSTMVIIMVSTTVCMYVGSEELLRNRYPSEFMLDLYDPIDGELAYITDKSSELADAVGLKVKDIENTSQLILLFENKTAEMTPYYGKVTSQMESNITGIITEETYAVYNNKYEPGLSDDEILLYLPKGKRAEENMSIMGQNYEVAGTIDKSSFNRKNYLLSIYDMYVVVVKDESKLKEMYSLYQQQLDAKAAELGVDASVEFNPPQIYAGVNFDVDGSDEAIVNLYNNLIDAFHTEAVIKQQDGESISKTLNVSVSSRTAYRDIFNAEYGGLLFLGIFLGITFLAATVLIIYYKQIAEGHDDKRRFCIMQQVGMSKEEVKRTIRTQVMLVFFLPLATAGCHIAGSFHMIVKLLNLLNLYNTSMFVIFTIVTVIAFALFYVAVYSLTAQVYYRIVNQE